MKIKIGLIGEDPNDTLSIQNLLLQKYPGVFHFKQLIKNKKGSLVSRLNYQIFN